jgi:hypothetical protein
MEWIANPSVGDWLRERLDPGFASMHGVVPRGYPAYARVFHPPLVDDAPTTWATTAAAFGTTMHPLAQWQRIVRTPVDGDWRTRIGPDAREYSAPLEGELDPEQLTAVADHLVEHTSTPDAGVVGLWDGHGGLLGHFGQTPSSAFAVSSDDPHHQAMLNRSTHDPFNNVFRRPTWQEGILSREISEGPRLTLPDREHVLFSAAPGEFADADWILRAAWRDVAAEERGFPPSAQSPSILWPEDRAWVLVTEVDFDSTIVAGSPELIRAICADARIEALPIREGADLGWDADEVNR